jgi:hypothetical protein
MSVPLTSLTLPALLDHNGLDLFQSITEAEKAFLLQASNLFRDSYYDHALLDLWNAAVCNLRRRVEAYSIELFKSVTKDEPGRKKYDKDGESLSERWSGVDDLVLIEGCSRLELLNRKAAKALEMINWMRNHASPAHASENKVEREDVIGLVLLLQKNLFEAPLPDPGHSVGGLFDPIRASVLDQHGIDLLKSQIDSLRKSDVRTAFGFMLDELIQGQKPGLDNILVLFPYVWNRASEELWKAAGLKYQTLQLTHAGQPALLAAKDRLLEFLTAVKGIMYIPDGARAGIYRQASKLLAEAKDTSYGWTEEVKAAKSLAQFGPYVPRTVFEVVYQEILAVWCGNYWGRSTAYTHLEPFLFDLDTRDLRRVVELFHANERVRSELFQSKPKARAVELLTRMKDEKFSLQVHKNEIEAAIAALP